MTATGVCLPGFAQHRPPRARMASEDAMARQDAAAVAAHGRRPLWTIAALVAVALCCAAPGRAQQIDTAALEAAIDAHIAPLRSDPQLIEALRTQNARTAAYDAPRIEQLDADWRAEIGAADRPTIAPVVGNPVSQMLRARAQASDGWVTELLLMDARGLNVAVSQVTSDFWQGDEAKFLETYPRGAEARHVGPVEFDDSSQLYMVQISMTVADPQSGAPLGALTVGVNAEMLQ